MCIARTKTASHNRCTEFKFSCQNSMSLGPSPGLERLQNKLILKGCFSFVGKFRAVEGSKQSKAARRTVDNLFPVPWAQRGKYVYLKGQQKGFAASLLCIMRTDYCSVFKKLHCSPGFSVWVWEWQRISLLLLHWRQSKTTKLSWGLFFFKKKRNRHM